MAAGKSSSAYVISAIIAAIALGAGFVLGYLLRPHIASDITDTNLPHDAGTIVDSRGNYSFSSMESCGESTKDDPDMNRYLANCQSDVCQASSCYIPQPSHYVVYHVDTHSIVIDGKLDEQAWREVSWSAPFVDIRGEGSPTPRYETKMKLRYDDVNLYLAFYMEEPDVWANITKHDGPVYGDNCLQILIDTKQNNHKYKEIVMNALGTVSDIMMTKPYIDDGEQQIIWESDVKRSIYIDGSINDPNKPSTFWTVEMAIPFKSLFFGVKHKHSVPSDRDTWRANFVRVEYEVIANKGKYEKKAGGGTDLWQWYANGVINSHIPDIWGLIQFRKLPANSTEFQISKYWVVSNALSEIFRAERAYKAVTGRYTDKLDLLHIPPYVLSKQCIQKIDIKLDWSGFVVTVTPVDRTLKQGHIRTDRFTWYGDDKDEVY
ncbi:hypothetical protein SNE40_009170 [Patella caerulea]|uniref:Carbohydrate-binding domain-containing protein n=1 Tax=Patella caerulea TaxID=87958 RepID=A0AAN8JXS0_PATCE